MSIAETARGAAEVVRPLAPRAAAVLAIVPGRVLQLGFGVAGLVRPAAKPLHPAGTLQPVTIRRFGLSTDHQVGVPWIDEPGTTRAVARFSRATGLPQAVPDIHGLAIRMQRSDGTPADILLATTGLGPATRFVLMPSRSAFTNAYSTLIPYKTPRGPVLMAAIPRAPGARSLDLAIAAPRGSWIVFGVLEVDDPQDEHGERLGSGDESISFDPVLNQLDDLDYYAWATQLREGAYQAARWSRSRRASRGAR